MSLIEAHALEKRYGTVRAVYDVTFRVEPGEIVALLGRNGAGKTTTIELLLGLRAPDAGSASIRGHAPTTRNARVHVGAMPQHTGFPDGLRVSELLALAAAHYPTPVAAKEILATFDLTELADKRVGELSGGQQRRVALALAFVGNPSVVMLDEPSTGLDVEARRALWEQIRHAADETRCVLFTTHYLEEAEALATRIIVIDGGELRFDGAPRAFRERFGACRLEYIGAPLVHLVPEGATSRTPDGRTVVTTDDTDAYVRALVASATPFSNLRITQSSFEEVFLDLVGGNRS